MSTGFSAVMRFKLSGTRSLKSQLKIAVTSFFKQSQSAKNRKIQWGHLGIRFPTPFETRFGRNQRQFLCNGCDGVETRVNGANSTVTHCRRQWFGSVSCFYILFLESQVQSRGRMDIFSAFLLIVLTIWADESKSKVGGEDMKQVFLHEQD